MKELERLIELTMMNKEELKKYDWKNNWQDLLIIRDYYYELTKVYSDIEIWNSYNYYDNLVNQYN